MQLPLPVFFNWETSRTVVDVRPVDAFRKGHFPGAVSFPAEGFASTEALLQALWGMDLARPFHVVDLDGRMAGNVTEDCDADFLQGGYKAYKTWMNAAYTAGPAIGIIGGKTGSGKTVLLQGLAAMGRQVLDMEAIAKHRGSVFGGLSGPQPSLEQFEYNLLKAWLSLDSSMPVWMEEKSAVLGKLGIPKNLYRKMVAAVRFELDQPFESRLLYIREGYTVTDKRKFLNGIRQLETRMGFSGNHKALHFYVTGQMDNCLRLLLRYYDAAYDYNRTRYNCKCCTAASPEFFTEKTSVLAMEKLIMESI
jgi:tRNA 2-selenouridine synthase SelU